ncbi:MAG: AAA family ATPase [Acidobacteria bacterium]|nr:AAA family ATPase [Acidobacteriota bacterium]
MLKQPFSISPNPHLLYLTSALQVTLEKVRFVVDSRQGLTAILGDVGLGKSSIIRYLFNEYDARDEVAATLIPSPNFPSEFAFLKKICADFGLPARRSMGDQENELRNFLVGLYTEDKVCVVFIDEAQRLPGRQLELVRTLLNFETDETKLIQVVLSAQLELRTKLMDSSKKALRSRIFAPSMLAPLSLNETEEMVEFRCKQAGVRNTFTKLAVETLYTLTGGVPRELLKIAAVAWKFSEADGHKITPELITEAAGEAVLAVEQENA